MMMSDCFDLPLGLHDDGKPYKWTDFIKEAKRLGFDTSDGFSTTSAAAAYLRSIGKTVTDAPILVTLVNSQ